MTDAPALKRYRGDTHKHFFNLFRPTGEPIDVTGYSFTLTVSTKRDPTDTTGRIITMPGVIESPTIGRISFAPTLMESSQAPIGVHFYDIQQTDAGGLIETIAKSTYEIRQDISK